MSTYAEALKAAETTGVAHCTDAQLMASFCQANIQTLCGALSPQLVWEGAQKKGLTALQLAHLATTDVNAVEALMWL